MNLKTVYEGVKLGSLGTYPTHETKTRFGLRGVNFCRGAAKLSGAVPKKGYPYHNKGGIAVFGEVYFNIEHPSNGETLEICLAESGPYYRTNGPRGYGININLGHGSNRIVMGPPQEKYLEEWTEEKMAEVIRKFLKG